MPVCRTTVSYTHLDVYKRQHHSVLKEGNEYYMVYHRHDNPHSNRGFHRQLCVDRMEFAEDGSCLLYTSKVLSSSSP